MYQLIIKPFLFALNIEYAYRIVKIVLRTIGLIPGGRWLLRKRYRVEDPSLEREVFGLKFRNPVGLAAGFDRNAELFSEMSAIGFSFVEIGAVTPKPQSGAPRPRIFRLPKDKAIINRMGVESRGLESVIASLRHSHSDVVIGCNIAKNSATPPENGWMDYLKSFRNLYEYVDYFTVNISCNCATVDSMSYTHDKLTSILEPLFAFRRGQNHYRPILVKVSPDMPDQVIDLVTEVLMNTPLDGIVATNGSTSREGLNTSRSSILKIGAGRISGAPLTARSIEIVRRIHSSSGGCYPIIGVGGVMTPQDVKAMLDAGASLVQIYTGFIYDGPDLVKRSCEYLVESAKHVDQGVE